MDGKKLTEVTRNVLERVRRACVYASDRMRWPTIAAVAAWAEGGPWCPPVVPDFSHGPAAANIGYGAVNDMLDAISEIASFSHEMNDTQRESTATLIVHTISFPDVWIPKERYQSVFERM